jgi:hypothetical protein
LKVTYSEQNIRWETIVSSQQFAIKTFEKEKIYITEFINYVRSYATKHLNLVIYLLLDMQVKSYLHSQHIFFHRKNW